MTNEQLVNRFKNEKIAINCQTKEQAKDFIKWVYANGMSWTCDTDKKTSFYSVYENDTCYRYDEINKIAYANKTYYKQYGYEVITYTDFFKGLENEPIKKNFIPQISEMLGLEIGEEIDMYFSNGNMTSDSPFKLTDTNFVNKNGTHSPCCLSMIIIGEYSFKKHQPILDKVEKRYLENVLRPFKDRVEKITKVSDIKREYLRVVVINEASMLFPYFDENTMYKGMKADKPYTLEEMGLFADER